MRNEVLEVGNEALHTVFIALGSNLGDGPVLLDRAVALIAEQIGKVLCVSSYMESEPWGFVSEHRFTNAVCVVRTSLEPLPLLDATQMIERQMGRTQKHRVGESYTDRIIDLDILLYDDLNYQDERLTIPHPFIADRDFVRIPLQECIEKIEISYEN